MKSKSFCAPMLWLTLVSLALAGCGGGGGNDPIPAGDGLTGTWDTYYYQETTSKDWLGLRQSGGTLEGHWNPSAGSAYSVTGTIDGSLVKIQVQAPEPAHFSIDAQVASDGQTMSGTWIVSGTGSLDGTHPWRAVKRP